MALEENNVFKCNVCKKVFSQKSNLNIHMLSVHDGKKVFQCKICEQRFSEKGSMNRHIESIHEGKKPQLYSKELSIY